MAFFKKVLRQKLLQGVLSVKKHKQHDAILIFSDARGGSTWLMEILDEIRGTSIIWEPLHNEFGVFGSNVKFGFDQFLPSFIDEEKGLEQLNEVFEGRLVNDWTLTQSPFLGYFSSDRLIIKFVRANALLPWITDFFDFRTKPIYLLRHPIAVAQSQLKNFYKDKSLEKIQSNENGNVLLKHQEFLDSLEDGLEQFVAFWCIHNYETLKASGQGSKWLTVFYEDLLLSPMDEVRRIFESLNEKVPEKILNKINKPSRSNFNDHYVSDSRKQLEKWVGEITPEQQDRISQILDHFDIKVYTAFNPYPVNKL